MAATPLAVTDGSDSDKWQRLHPAGTLSDGIDSINGKRYSVLTCAQTSIGK